MCPASQNGDVMRSDRLKQVMQEIDNSFDEKNLGISKFSRFCLEAAQRGLISVNKLENGQLEVGLPKEPSAAAPGAEAPPRAVAVTDESGPRETREEAGRREERSREDRIPGTAVSGATRDPCTRAGRREQTRRPGLHPVSRCATGVSGG